MDRTAQVLHVWTSTPPEGDRVGADVAAGNQEDRHRTADQRSSGPGRVRRIQRGDEKGLGNSRVSRGHESRKGSRLMTYSTWRATVVAAPKETG